MPAADQLDASDHDAEIMGQKPLQARHRMRLLSDQTRVIEKGAVANLQSALRALRSYAHQGIKVLCKRELIGRLVVILTDLAKTGIVSLLGATTDGQQFEVVGKRFQDGVGGTFFICIGLLLLVDRSASPFAGLRSASIVKWPPEESTNAPKSAKL